MFNINLLNNPGKQDENTVNKNISFDNQDVLPKSNNQEKVDLPPKIEFHKDTRIDLFSIVIIFLIVAIIISILIGYYLKYLWLK